MKTEDKFLLSSGVSFILLIIFKIACNCINTDNMSYNLLMKWLDISLYITIVISVWMVVSLIGFFITYKLRHGNFQNNNHTNVYAKVECPYCHSMNTSKIGTVNRAVSVAMFGLASKKIGKQWHCNNCKSDF